MTSHQISSKNLDQYLVGLTGNICSGKSKAAEYFKELGAYVIDMDKLVHEMYKKNIPLKYKLYKNFGLKIFNKKLEVDRKKLGNIVFSDSSKMKRLEEITWPYVGKESRKKINGMNGVIILEAAMLYESGFGKKMDKNVLVLSTEENQIKRLVNRNNLTKEEALKRINSQKPSYEKVFLSDYVIFNNDGFDMLKENVEHTWKSLVHDFLQENYLSTGE